VVPACVGEGHGRDRCGLPAHARDVRDSRRPSPVTTTRSPTAVAEAPRSGRPPASRSRATRHQRSYPPAIKPSPVRGRAPVVAVGNYNDTTDNGRDLIDTLSAGIWTPSEAPLPSNAIAGSSLFEYLMSGGGVVCGRRGTTKTPISTSTVQIETLSSGVWTGHRKHRFPPDLPTTNHAVWFTDLACPAAGSCVAVGQYTDYGPDLQVQPFIDTLSDGTWTSMAAPLPANAPGPTAYAVSDQFSSLTCPAVGSCVGRRTVCRQQ